MEKYLRQYAERFNDGFPMIPLGWGRSEEEVIKIIERCLRENKDVYELKLVTDDNNVLY